MPYEQGMLDGKAIMEAFGKLLDAAPRGKRALIFHESCSVEVCLMHGLQAMRQLHLVRKYFLDTPALGGEDSPIVKAIDKLIER